MAEHADDLQRLSDEIRDDIKGWSGANGASLKKAVDLGAKLLAASDLLPHGQLKKWIAEQKFGVQYNWCRICVRASEAADLLMADGKYSWESICERTATVKDLAAMRDRAVADDPWAKPKSKPAERKPTLAEALARLAALEARVAELEEANHG